MSGIRSFLKKTFKKKSLLLVLVLLLAAFLRFYQLGINPPALTWDETAWGYNAYSLGLTGRDEFGRFLPLDYLESFGDFKPPIYAYLAVLPIKIFGLNEFAVRFPSALFGTLTVFLTYFLAKEILKDSNFAEKGGLLASFFLAISPWHVMLSRAAFEANVATFFLIGGVTSFLLGVKRKGWFLALAAISFALGLETFNTARIVAPLLVLGLVIVFRKRLWQKKKWVVVAALAGVIVLLPAIPFFLTPQAQLRFKEVNIFSDPGVVIKANQEMANDNWSWWSRIIHNRRWGYTQEFLRHYFDHFNPAFLFFKGDGNPKFSTQDVGQLYLWELPFLVLGSLLLFKKKQGHWWLIPYWLLIGIIPAATARETPHALRIETTLPTWQILTAMGFLGFWGWFQKLEFKKVFKFLIIIVTFSLLFLNFVYFQHGYWRHYPIEYAGEWQYGYKPAIEFIKTVESEYDKVWVTDALGRPYIYFLFYLQDNPQSFWQEAIVEREVYGFVKVKSFGKYHFSSKFDFEGKGKSLYLDKPGNLPPEAKVIKDFYLLNEEKVLVAFEV